MTKRVADLTFLKKCNDSGVLLHSLGSNSIIEVLIFLEFSPKPATPSCAWKSISSGTTLIAYHRDYTTSILNQPLLSSLISGPVLNADLLSQPVSSLNLPLINKSIKFPIFIPSNISLIFQLVRLLSNPSPQQFTCHVDPPPLSTSLHSVCTKLPSLEPTARKTKSIQFPRNHRETLIQHFTKLSLTPSRLCLCRPPFQASYPPINQPSLPTTLICPNLSQDTRDPDLHSLNR